MKRRSLLQAMLAGLLVPWDKVATAHPAPRKLHKSQENISVDVYESEFGVSIIEHPEVLEAQHRMNEELRADVERVYAIDRDGEGMVERVHEISPPESPFFSGVRHEHYDEDSWSTDGLR